MKRRPKKDMKFAERLKELRTERCLSMDRLCEQINKAQNTIRVSKSTISRYENGEQEPMLSTVAVLASFFGVSPVYLMGDIDERYNFASNIQNSNVVQGNNATTLIVRNGGIHERELNDNEVELLRIFEVLDVKGRTALMSYAFELEEKQQLEKSHGGI